MGTLTRIDGEDGEIGDGPLPAVFGDEGNAVALFRAPTQKSLSERMDALVDLVGGERLPVPELVLPEDSSGIGSRRDAAKQVIDGGEWSRCHVEV